MMKISDKVIRKKQSSAAAGMTCAIIHTAFWGFAVGFAVFALIAGVPFDEFLTVFLGSAVFVFLGAIWIKNTAWKQRCLRDCTKYYQALTAYSRISIKEFAGILNEDPKQMRQNITYVINNRCIEGIRYTYRDDCITVAPEVQSVPKHEPKPQPKTEALKPPKKQTMVAVSCESCCGITMLPINSVGVCEYCGSKIKS